MIPYQVEPSGELETIYGKVEKVKVLDGVLKMKLHIYQSTHSLESDVFTFDLSNQFVFRTIMQQIGGICWSNRMIDFNKLVTCDVIVCFTHVTGERQVYRNFTSISVLDLLVDYSYQGDDIN